MKLLKIHLRYYPPGIILEYTQKGDTKHKEIDLLNLDSETNITELADSLQIKEILLTKDVRAHLEQCLDILKKRIEHEGPAGKRFYIYKTLMTHVLPLTNVAFDKSGKQCITGSYDRTCKVWDVEAGTEQKTLEGHQNVVYSVAYNFPQCNRIITGSFDKSAKIWDAKTGECLYTLWGHTGEVVAAQFSTKGNYAATGSMDNTAKLYDVNTGTELQTYTGHTGEVIALQFDPNEGQRLITGSFDGTISMWDTRMKDRAAVLTGHEGEISNVQFNWDSSLVGSSSLDGSAKLWDARQTACLATVSGHTDEVLDICFDWAGQRLATASSDCSARIYDVKSDFKELACMKGHREEVNKVCFSPAGGSLLTASADRSARIWNAATGNCIQVLSGHQGEIFSCAYSYAGDAIITASKDNTCRIWRQHLQDLEVIGLVAAGAFYWIYFHRHFFTQFHTVAIIITASKDNTCRIWSVKCEYKWETKWFKVPLDHFGYQRNETFQIKYLVNEDHWDKGGGPIFFYTGNEVLDLLHPGTSSCGTPSLRQFWLHLSSSLHHSPVHSSTSTMFSTQKTKDSSPNEESAPLAPIKKTIKYMAIGSRDASDDSK
ncbi:dynein assembly factor with WDR repeat domains 1 [Phthorimaea operculella]|nr:dynein assembly factor with WDR repeat domains 1 [Phthorimaea operculella]